MPQVKLQREALKTEAAEARLDQSKSAFIEAEQNVARLQRQNDALLAERVDLYMKMQNLESQLSIATTDKENLDKQLMSLVNMPTKLEEISSQVHAGQRLLSVCVLSAMVCASQGVRQIACGARHVLALCDTGDVYAWGAGTSGQLGLGKTKSYPSPQLVWGMMRKGTAFLTNRLR